MGRRVGDILGRRARVDEIRAEQEEPIGRASRPPNQWASAAVPDRASPLAAVPQCSPLPPCSLSTPGSLGRDLYPYQQSSRGIAPTHPGYARGGHGGRLGGSRCASVPTMTIPHLVSVKMPRTASIGSPHAVNCMRTEAIFEHSSSRQSIAVAQCSERRDGALHPLVRVIFYSMARLHEIPPEVLTSCERSLLRRRHGEPRMARYGRLSRPSCQNTGSWPWGVHCTGTRRRTGAPW